MLMPLAYSAAPALLMRDMADTSVFLLHSAQHSQHVMAESRLKRACSAQRDMRRTRASRCVASIARSDERKSWEEARHYLIRGAHSTGL